MPAATDESESLLDIFQAPRPLVVFSAGSGSVLNLAGVMVELIVGEQHGWEVFTNAPFKWSDDDELLHSSRVHRVGALSELLRGSAGAGLRANRPAWILCDLDKIADDQWSPIFELARKLEVRGPLLVFKTADEVPTTLREGWSPRPLPTSFGPAARRGTLGELTGSSRGMTCDACGRSLSGQRSRDSLFSEGEGEVASFYSVWALCDACKDRASAESLGFWLAS